MTAKSAKGNAIYKIDGVCESELWNKKAKRRMIRLAKDLLYDLIDPEIGLKIERAESEIEAERLLIACRHAM